MTPFEISTSVDADGILLATLDMPGRSMNVFSRELMDALDRLITRVNEDARIRAVVLTSGKPTFLAGADLEMIQVFTERARVDSPPVLKTLCGHLGRVFRRLELSQKPFVAAINGLALGGGLEVCLACHSRVASQAGVVQLGVPEVKLGLLPGAGGTQRLPRLIGAEPALSMLLGGESVSSQQALSLGLVDVLVPPERLLEAARSRALALVGVRPRAAWDRPAARFDAGRYDFDDPQVADSICKRLGIAAEQRRHYPAIEAIIDCVAGGWNLDMTAACEREMDIFVELIREPVAGNMVRTLFLNRQKASKAGLLGPQSPYRAGADALLPRLKALQSAALNCALGELEQRIALAGGALLAWAEGWVEQPELADVAVVSDGLFADYTGGPFTFIDQCQTDELRSALASVQARLPALAGAQAALERWLREQEAMVV